MLHSIFKHVAASCVKGIVTSCFLCNRPTPKAREKNCSGPFAPCRRQPPPPPQPLADPPIASLRATHYVAQRREAIVQGADAIMKISNDAAKEFDKAVLATMLKVACC